MRATAPDLPGGIARNVGDGTWRAIYRRAVARMAGSYGGVVYQPALRPPSTAITWPVT